MDFLSMIGKAVWGSRIDEGPIAPIMECDGRGDNWQSDTTRHLTLNCQLMRQLPIYVYVYLI